MSFFSLISKKDEYGVSKGGIVNPNGGLFNTNIVTESSLAQSLRSKAKFVGKWVNHHHPYWADNGRSDLSRDAMLTINGAYLETQTTGTYVEVDLIHNSSWGLPFVGWEINGIFQQTVWLPDVNSDPARVFTFNIPCQPNDIIRFHIEGLGDGNQAYEMWPFASGESIVDIRSNGTLTPTPQRPTVLILGDSIGEGGSQNFRNLYGQAKAQSTRTAWSGRVCKALGYDYINSAFGNTGMTHDGGRSPGADAFEHLKFHFEGKAVQNTPQLVEVFEAHGHNDTALPANNNMTPAEYKVVYTNFVNEIIGFTGVKPICCIPFSGHRRQEKSEVAAAMGLKVVDMRLFQYISTTDTIHPDVNGHRNAAFQFLEAYKNL